MSELKLNINYSTNEGLVISPSELIEMYLTGIPLCYPDGSVISFNSIKQKIQSAQENVENYLSIKIKKQKIIEEADFIREEFFRWGYIKTIFPIMQPLSLDGYINEVQQVHYPKEWLNINKGNDSTKFRNLYLIPNTSGSAQQTQNSFIFTGISPHIGFFGTDFIPNYWRMEYCTGWDKVPQLIIDVIAKMAAIQILAIAGDIVFGAGVGNSSISIDGISQNFSTTKGQNGAFSGRIKQFTQEYNEDIKKLKAEYLGIMFKMM